MMKLGDIYQVELDGLKFCEFDVSKGEWGAGFSYKKGTRFIVLSQVKDTDIIKVLIEGNIKYFYESLYGIRCLNE